MAKRIEDVVPQHRNLATVSNETLIATLFIRGVSIKDIFGRYYEYQELNDAVDDEIHGNDEEGQHGAQLTVGDAELAGVARLPETPQERQPF